MTQVLKMVFSNDTTKDKTTWTLKDPKTNLNVTQVATAMNGLLADEIVATKDSSVLCDMMEDAYIYQTNKIELSA
jgi:hypothetical protein